MASAAFLVGRTLGHYRIIDEIGAGAMGIVYRARDERLERDVALKVLPPQTLTDEASRKRFRREALALSQINHPNIATIHDFDTQEDVDCLVMEYIAGTTLSEMLTSGPLSEREVIDLGVQMADGLSEAHEHRVVHRDLKPGNVRITRDGRLKILDFGLARMERGDAATAATTMVSGTHLIEGTLAYMAPEQLLGSEIDGRTDVHAAGLVLYEMATGRRPFAEREQSQLIGALLHRAPVPPGELNPALSAEIRRIIDRCLEKRPQNRYQTARELAADLRRLQGGGSAATLRDQTLRAEPSTVESLAVLPFENLSGDPAQDFFAHGITESLITDLGRLTGLKRVIARGSVMRYQGTTKSPAEIARELNVDALITGAVVRTSDRVRVTAQLINPTDGEQRWAEQYERSLTDVLRLQNELAMTIASEIRVKLTAVDQARLASAGSVSPDAFDAYLMGRYHWYKMTPLGLDRAVEYFQLALDHDPKFARAYAGIGYVWGIRAHAGFIPAADGYAKAKSAALRTLELDDTLAEGHDLLASALTWFEWEWAAGETEYRRAIDLNPSFADVRAFYSFFLHAMRRPPEASAQIEQALALDPYNPLFHYGLGMELVNDRRVDEALVHLQRAATLQPDNLFLHSIRWCAFDQKEEYKEALFEACQYFTLLGVQEVAQALARGSSRRGYRGAMHRAAAKLAAKSTHASVNPCDVARLYAFAGDDDHALDWLEKACDVRATRLPYLNVFWEFDSLRSHPRFQAVLRRMNIPP